MPSNEEIGQQIDISLANMKTYPTIEDLNREELPHLEPNLTSKAYNNSEHYLKTQFSLLREELVRPLVESVAKVRDLAQSVDKKSKTFKELLESEPDLNVYTGVHVLRPNLNPYCGLVLTMTLDHELLEDVDWSESQRLMEGSLLCLSSDKFKTSIIFGVITNRNIVDKGLKVWQFDLQLDFDSNNKEYKHLLNIIMNPMVEYIGVESLTYYEGIRHSLSKLQTMAENFPLKRYIVDMNTDVKPPPYLDEESCYDMSCIAKDSNKVDETVGDNNSANPLSSVRLLKTEKGKMFQIQNSSTFDVKQFEAFNSALTKQFAIIQGPPGTGKTFVGLKIVKCLLDNQRVWSQSGQSGPILIVCYKNHALDQFLEGILKFNQNIVRIGGKSESQALKDYLLKSLKENASKQIKQNKTNFSFRLDPEMTKAKKKSGTIFWRIKSIYEDIECLLKKVEDSFKRIIDFEDIKFFIRRRHMEQLPPVLNPDDNPVANWLNFEESVDFENKIKNKLNKKRLSLEKFDDVYSLNDILYDEKGNEVDFKQRFTLYLFWREKYLKDLEKKIILLLNTLKDEIEKWKPMLIEFERLLCKDSLVIGLTITGAAKYSKLVEALNPKIMIVEEAAEVLEGHVVAAMASQIEHIILIGDHEQLRPITNVHELTKKYNLDISLFERMAKNGMQLKQLTLQHRMRPCISELLKVADIYKDLRNDETVTKYPQIKFTFNKNMFFLSHNNIEDSNNVREVVDKSRSNLFEAKFIVELVKYFLLRKYPSERITVLTTYNAQLSLIKNLMFEQKEIFLKPKEDNCIVNGDKDSGDKPELKVRVSSVDGFQGEENDIIIISFVRSSKKESIGFLGIKNRVCVALSRARHGLFCVGNFKNMAKQSDMWRNIVEYLERNQYFGDELVVDCDCKDSKPVFISMPNQFELFNLQTKNRGECDCVKS